MNTATLGSTGSKFPLADPGRDDAPQAPLIAIAGPDHLTLERRGQRGDLEGERGSLGAIRHHPHMLEDDIAQLVDGRRVAAPGLLQMAGQFRQGLLMTGVEDGVFVREIVVQRRLPHIQPGRDVIQRGGFIPSIPKCVEGRPEDFRLALLPLGLNARGLGTGRRWLAHPGPSKI